MTTILDKQTANTYFGQKSNSTSTISDYEDSMAAETPAVYLRQIWLKERMLPSTKSFISDKKIENQLRSIYAQDEVFRVS